MRCRHFGTVPGRTVIRRVVVRGQSLDPCVSLCRWLDGSHGHCCRSTAWRSPRASVSGSRWRVSRRVSSRRTFHCVDSERARSVPRGPRGRQQRQCGRTAGGRPPRNQLGRRRIDGHRVGGHAVRRVSEQSRRAFHDSRIGVRAGSTGGLALNLRQPDVRDDLSSLQPRATLQPGVEQHHGRHVFCPRHDPRFSGDARLWAVFTDVDQQGSGAAAPYSRTAGAYSDSASTVVEYYGADNRLLFRSAVPASPGNASLSFFGAMFSDARIARVRIAAGSLAPGPFDDVADVVMMDDFVYGEPQAASVAVSSTGRR